MDNDSVRAYLGAIAFRFSYLTDGLSDDFADFSAGHGVRTPLEILRHMSELVIFSLSQFKEVDSLNLEQTDWQSEKARFLGLLKSLDESLSKNAECNAELMQPENLWQGPLADTMTHIGQLAMLRRLWGQPLEKINYWKAPTFDFSKL